MFHISESMLNYWNEHPEPKAKDFEIDFIETRVGSKLPCPYVDFITRYGSVIFGRDSERRCFFDYLVIFPDRREIHEGDIAFLREPMRLIQAYDNLTTPEYEGDKQKPCFPSNYLPVGSDAGQGQILLDLSENSGKVWYWPERYCSWGTEDNTWLGFVANDFYEFINKLRP
ncbi:MAG: SMI1/KNR4 family protein [Candidatus Methylumidiphilus sp.]